MLKIENTLFPGRPDYIGPTSGTFGLLHHEVLCESSHDVMERVDYIKKHKPKNEVAVRLHNLIYLGGCEAATDYEDLDADYEAKHADYKAKRVALYADYEAKFAPLAADYAAKRAPLDAEILAYIKSNMPDCAWNGKTLVFPCDELPGGNGATK